MERDECAAEAKRILACLVVLQTDWGDKPMDMERHIQRRELLKVLEAELAVIRFLQSERRLIQQLWIAIPSVFGGSLITLIVQKLFG